MRIVVVGGRGQLVSSLVERAPMCGHELVAVGLPALDLAVAQDGETEAVLAAARPDAIINAAAYTAVDKAESERDLAFAINASGAGAVARAAARLGVPLVHISTDYVFSGDKAGPYVETDAVGATSVYGASKLAGEQLVRGSGSDAVILRTAWLYSPFGRNFISTMLGLAKVQGEVRVVDDQHGSPTSALDLADAAITVLTNLTRSPDPALRGLFHAAGAGEATWADLATEVFAISRAAGEGSARVRRIATTDYPTAARRPANSRLDCSKLADIHGVRFSHWIPSVKTVTARLVREAAVTS